MSGPALLALLLAGAGSAAPHPNSRSSSLVSVRGAGVRVELRCQVLSLLEVLPGLDADGDGYVLEDELERAAREVGAYAGEHFRLRTGTAPDGSGGRRLAPRLEAVAPVPPDPSSLLGAMEWVDVVLDFRAPRALDDLAVDMALFLDTSPDHLDVTTVEWNGAPPSVALLSARHPSWRWSGGGAAAFAQLGVLGAWRVFSTWQHLAFVAALVLATRRPAGLLGAVLAFASAAALALALAGLDLVELSGWGGFVEAAVALSVAYLAADLLLFPGRAAPRGPEAALFGLVHGLSLAAAFTRPLAMQPSQGTAVLALGLGVVLGALAAAAGFALLLGLPRVLGPRSSADRPASEPAPFLAPAPLRVGGSLALAALGLYGFVERVWL